MADRTTPIHSGYSIINASFSGTATAKLGCWMEYKVVSQSVENNTSTIRFYIFIANVAASSGYHIYCNNYDQTNRGSMTVKANGTTVYTRQKRGFATDLHHNTEQAEERGELHDSPEHIGRIRLQQHSGMRRLSFEPIRLRYPR